MQNTRTKSLRKGKRKQIRKESKSVKKILSPKNVKTNRKNKKSILKNANPKTRVKSKQKKSKRNKNKINLKIRVQTERLFNDNKVLSTDSTISSLSDSQDIPVCSKKNELMRSQSLMMPNNLSKIFLPIATESMVMSSDGIETLRLFAREPDRREFEVVQKACTIEGQRRDGRRSAPQLMNVEIVDETTEETGIQIDIIQQNIKVWKSKYEEMQLKYESEHKKNELFMKQKLTFESMIKTANDSVSEMQMKYNSICNEMNIQKKEYELHIKSLKKLNEKNSNLNEEMFENTKMNQTIIHLEKIFEQKVNVLKMEIIGKNDIIEQLKNSNEELLIQLQLQTKQTQKLQINHRRKHKTQSPAMHYSTPVKNKNRRRIPMVNGQPQQSIIEQMKDIYGGQSSGNDSSGDISDDDDRNIGEIDDKVADDSHLKKIKKRKRISKLKKKNKNLKKQLSHIIRLYDDLLLVHSELVIKNEHNVEQTCVGCKVQ